MQYALLLSKKEQYIQTYFLVSEYYQEITDLEECLNVYY